MFARDGDCWKVAEIQFQIKYSKFDSLLAGMGGWAFSFLRWLVETWRTLSEINDSWCLNFSRIVGAGCAEGWQQIWLLNYLIWQHIP